MSNHELSPFAWGDITLSQVVYIDDIPHTTRASIGEWLEYDNPQKAVDKIIERNPHLADRSVPVKLTATDGKNYDTWVYHPIGFLLIVMESGQPKAHAMKSAVADFVWRFAGPQTLSTKERLDFMKLRRNLITDLSRSRDAFARQALIADLRDISLSIGQPIPSAALLGKDPDQIDLPL
ncbi:hypothetical protein [Sedimenticola sp.]|uniref:hypothetical protein n=1 Tax=Sedimenticola sp. TaxID=1940285 RepID=UPI003D13AE19